MSDDEQEKYVASIFVELIFYKCLYSKNVIYATLVCALNPSENTCPSKWDLSQVSERSITKICWIRHLEYQSLYIYIYSLHLNTNSKSKAIELYSQDFVRFSLSKKNTYYILLHQKFFKYLPTNVWQIFPPWFPSWVAGRVVSNSHRASINKRHEVTLLR